MDEFQFARRCLQRIGVVIEDERPDFMTAWYAAVRAYPEIWQGRLARARATSDDYRRRLEVKHDYPGVLATLAACLPVEEKTVALLEALLCEDCTAEERETRISLALDMPPSKDDYVFTQVHARVFCLPSTGECDPDHPAIAALCEAWSHD